VKSSSTHDQNRSTFVFLLKKRRKPRKRSTCAREVKDPQTTLSHCLTAMKRTILLRKPMSVLTHNTDTDTDTKHRHKRLFHFRKPKECERKPEDVSSTTWACSGQQNRSDLVLLGSPHFLFNICDFFSRSPSSEHQLQPSPLAPAPIRNGVSLVILVSS